MDIRTLQSTVVDALDDLKAQDVKAFSTTGLTDLFDRVIVATGTSNRHTKSLAASVRDKVKARGGAIISMEGEESGEWVLVDLGDIVVHIMQPAIRNYYNLEELWGAKPVQLKPARERAAAAGRSTGAPPAAKKAARKPAARKGREPAAVPHSPSRRTAAAKAVGRRPAKKLAKAG
jgi:ribosome-associated protein